MKALFLIGAAWLTLPIAGQTLGSPQWQTIFAHDFSNRPIPKWAYGRLLTYSGGEDSPAAEVRVYGGDGSLQWRADAAPPSAQRVLLEAIAGWRDGTVAVTGSAWSREGAGAGFITWFDPNGKVSRTVRLQGAAAGTLAAAPDGSLWTLVRVYDEKDPRLPEVAQYDVLRQYGGDGKLLRSMVPRRTLSSDARSLIALTEMAVTEDSVYLMVNRLRTLFQISTATGKIQHRWPISWPTDKSGIDVTCLAVTSSNRIYLGAARGIYRLDPEAGTFQPVALGNAGLTPGKYVDLFGAEQDLLVVATDLPKLAAARVE